MPRRKTVQEKREDRNKKKAAKKVNPRSASPLDKLIANIKNTMGDSGAIMRGSEIQERGWDRRSWGVPTLDFICTGGLPKGGMVEIGGEYSTGKTTMCMHAVAHAQRTEPDKPVAWIALEHFSKQWARKNGVWIPFSEENGDPYENASELELERMEELGITDPYGLNGYPEFILVQEERGDVALDVALDILRSNLFSLGVVDSFGVAKNTKYIEEQDVQDASDFPREPRMLNSYTAKVCLALNRRYDENNQPSKDGKHRLQTTMIHINQITTNIGSQSRAPWKQFGMKGGKGVEHNHHIVIFLWKGKPVTVKVGSDWVTFGAETKAICIKNKLGTPFLQSSYDFYFRDYDSFRAGDVDIAKDALTLGCRAGLVEQRGAWYDIGEDKFNGRANAEDFLREEDKIREWLISESLHTLRDN